MDENVYYIGPCPADEDAVQVGAPDYARNARAQCRAYIDAIRKVIGPEPEGARLSIKSQNHDFGTYYEVICRFDGNDPAAAAYAARCDEEAPTSWEQAGMKAPTPANSRMR